MNEDIKKTLEEANDIPISAVQQVASPSKSKVSNPTDVMQSLWNISPVVAKAASTASQVYKIKHGMFAGVPIICKVDKCPYKDVCMIDAQYRILGQRCPMEAGAIIARFEAWCRHFNIDLTGVSIKDEDLVDASLIKDLVENEIQTIRAENRVALNADFIGKTVSQIDNKGKVYYEDTVTPEAEFKFTLQDKRYKIMNLLNSTRKDKLDKNKILTPSEKAVSIFKRVAEMMPDVDDMDFEDQPVVVQQTVSKEEQ